MFSLLELSVGSSGAIAKGESFVACECCGRLDLGRINTDCHGFVSLPLTDLPANPLIQRPGTDLTIRRTWRTPGCDSPFDRISVTAVSPLATLVEANWIHGFVQRESGASAIRESRNMDARVETSFQTYEIISSSFFSPGSATACRRKYFNSAAGETAL